MSDEDYRRDEFLMPRRIRRIEEMLTELLDAEQKRNAEVQKGPAPFRLEDRAESEEPQASHRDHDGRETEREGG